MVKVAVVDDDSLERQKIRECLAYITENDRIEFDIREFPSGNAFIGNFEPVYDIVFMDIEMPGMSGMETAKAMRETDASVVLIFVTNMVQYAVAGYEVEAMDFIVKPINRYSFAMKVKRAVNRSVRRLDDYIQVRTERENCSVRVSSIRYLEVTGHYVIYHTTDGNYTEYTTLKEAEQKLNRPVFVHPARSYLVNLQYVDAVNKDIVTVGQDEILISRPQRKAFMTAMSDYMGGRR